MAMRMLAQIMVLVSALLICFSPVALSAEDASQPDVSVEDQASDAEAIKFRQDFGLDANLDTVRSARIDTVNYSS